MIEKHFALRERTKAFSFSVIHLVKAAPHVPNADVLASNC